MLTVGVLYPAANCRMHTITVCFGIVYDYMFVPGIIIYHNVGFLHCPSLSTKGNAKAFEWWDGQGESHVSVL